jgi:hypothetical protein
MTTPPASTPVYKAFYKNSVYVQLDPVEIYVAAACGRKTWKESQDGKHHEYFQQKEDGPTGEMIQMLGDLAVWSVAKYLDRYPMGFRTYKGPDLSGNIEVRLIGVEWYGLRVYTKDIERSKLVVGVVIPKGKERMPHRIAGWIPAAEAGREEWIMNPGDRERPFYGVPQSELRHINTLPLPSRKRE